MPDQLRTLPQVSLSLKFKVRNVIKMANEQAFYELSKWSRRYNLKHKRRLDKKAYFQRYPQPGLIGHKTKMHIILERLENHRFFLVFLIAFAITVLRRPDIVVNAQFWAEDGMMWFTQMYRDGFISIFRPQDGYFQTISRLAAGLALFVPLEHAPLVMNLVFICIKSLLVAMLFTTRLDHLTGNNVVRVIVAIFILITPDAHEVHGNVTSAHWFLSCIALLLLLSKDPSNMLIKILDIPIVIIAGLSGPFAIIIAPLSVIWFYLNRGYSTFHNKVLTVCISITALIQATAVVATASSRSQVELGASLSTFLKVVSSRVFGPVFFGSKTSDNIWESTALTYGVSFFGFAILIYGFFKASNEVRIILAFGVLMLAAALISPMLTLDPSQQQWQGLYDAGSRYFAIPLVCVFIAFLVTVSKLWGRHILTNTVITLLFICVVVSLRNDFSLRPLSDCAWKESVAEFSQGETDRVKIPINPLCDVNMWHVSLESKG